MRSSARTEESTRTPEEQGALFAEQVTQLYDSALLGMLASIVNALILTIILRNVTSAKALIGWLSALMMTSLLRYLDIVRFRRRPPAITQADYWSKRFMYGLLLSGIIWGSSAVLLFPAGSLAHQTFLVFAIGGMVAGAAAAFSSVMKAFLAYSVPALAPIIVHFLLLGDEFHMAMGVMALLFGIMMLVIAMRIRAIRVTSVSLRFEKAGLEYRLMLQKHIEEALRESHDALEARVEDRTRELRKAYEDLKDETRVREQAEVELRQAQKMEAVGTLAGGIAHDFNNMLAVILGNAELALDDLQDRNGPRQNIEQIMKASKRARDLTKQILTFSRRTERGRKPLSLTPLLRETYELLRGTLPSTIRMELDIRTEADTVLGDPSQIQQVMINLATNAAHAMRNRGGVLTVGLSDVTVKQKDQLPDVELRPGHYLNLSVHDTGTGMTEDVRSRVFEPFFTTKERSGGTGMGLAVVYGIVKSHEGEITVESAPGKGSRFNVFFPLSTVEGGVGQEEDVDVPGGSERILIVDDEPAVLATASQMLRRLGYKVTTAEGGPQAWRVFEKEPGSFDLVITDQVMPDLRGTALSERIRRLRNELPVILLTGFSETVSAEEAKASGIRVFATKPLTKAEMAKTIRQVLDG